MFSLSRTPLVWSLGIVVSLWACSNSTTEEDPSGSNPPSTDYLTITVDPSVGYQVIESFGASDAWSIQFVGKNYPEDKKNQIADWLFSTERDAQGNYKGIGLSTWRFNIGAGSDRKVHGISDSWRRAETMYSPDGIDANGQLGQQWFMQAAKARGVEDFTGFVNSPPVALTRNGYAHSSGGNAANLAPSNYEAYAQFLTDLDAYFKEQGIAFSRISPVNEPQWDWTEGQEGTPWTNTEIANFARVFDASLTAAGSDTKIEITEAGQLDFLYSSGGFGSRGNQIDAFFNPTSSNYLGGIDRIGNHVAGHSYYTTYDEAYSVEVREQLAAASEQHNLKFVMSEYCILEGNAIIDGNSRDFGMDAALYTARLMQSDLVIANAVSWQWWLAVSPYDYKDGLVYIDYNKNNSTLYDSKLLWAMGQFSQFIRPGSTRVKTSRSDLKTFEQSLSGLSVSAYKNQGNTVVVVVNQRNIDIPIAIDVTGSSKAFQVYQTSAKSGEDLKSIQTINPKEIYQIPARSVVTFVNQ